MHRPDTSQILALRLFRWFCRPDLVRSIEGDLIELYHSRVELVGATRARLLMFIDVLLLFRPGIIKSINFSFTIIRYDMIRNYLLTAYRNLAKNKTYSIINITGLALGIAASLLMLGYLRFERNYDSFHENADRIYRVPMTVTEKGTLPQRFAFTYPAVAGALKADFPEIEDAIRIRKGSGLVTVDDVKIPKLVMRWVDKQFLTMFSFPFAFGDTSALDEINSAVLTRKIANQLFGVDDARGKTFGYGGNLFQVSAVIEDVPVNSHLQFDILLSFQKYIELAKGFGGDADGSWGWSDFYTYVLLKEDADVDNVRRKLVDFADRYLGERMKTSSFVNEFQLQPLLDIHTRSNYDYEFNGSGNYKYLDYVVIASVFILLMAWLNYVNLSTSRSLERVREVGVRKSIGAHRAELMYQFLFESMVVNGIAIFVGFALANVALPTVGNLIGKPLTLPSVTDFTFWGITFAALVIGAMMSGFYPAFVLSSFRPSQALKGKLSIASGGLFRKAMVVVQVTLAVILIAGTIGLIQQVRFMRNQDLGVNIDKKLVLSESVGRDTTYSFALQAFATELKKIPDIKQVAFSSDVPGDEVGSSSTFRQPSDPSGKRCRTFAVDENFFTMYNLSLVAGRPFERTRSDERTSLIINETAVKVLGFESPEDAIQKKLVSYDEGDPVFTIVGVIKDYHQESLQYEFNPTVFYLGSSYWDYYSLEVEGAEYSHLVAKVQDVWKRFFPDSPFTYFFLDQYYNAQYRTENTFEILLSSFTVLGIVVACLGLLGLSSFTVSRRTKEIGIRKVLGARVGQIISLLTKEYLVLVVLASILAIPVAVFLFDQWLTTYAFRVSLGWWFFVTPVALIVVITLLAVGLQSLKAAWVNPVRSLRSE
ncbi:MAG: ABC transporter permease [Cyclobacteriaceae bacterium]